MQTVRRLHRLVVLSLIPLLAYMLLLFGMIRDQQRDAVAATLERAAQGVSNAVLQRLTDQVSHLAGLAQSTALDRADIESFRTEAQRLLVLRTDWRTVILTDDHRQLVNLRFQPEEALPPLRDPDTLQQVITTRRPAVGNFSGNTIGIRFPVLRNGPVQHTIVAALKPTAISEPLESYGLPDRWIGTVIDGNGVIVGRNRMAERFLGTPANPDIRARLGSAASGVFEATNEEGSEVYAFTVPIADTAWHVAIAAPVIAVEAKYREIMWLLIGGAAFTAVLAVALAIALVRRGTRVVERRVAEFQGARDRADLENREKSAFLAMMSHELRTPLNGILGFAEALARSGPTPEQARHLAHQKQAAHSLLRLINDILDYSKIEAGKLELEAIPFDLAALIDECVALVRPMAETKRLDVAVTPAPDLPRLVCGDPLRLQQILVNLLGNAVKFTERGAIQVSVGQQARDDGALDLLFAVRDTGPGIPAERMNRLFRRFSQADASTTRRYGGTGLGLAICRALVELMGGTIDVQSVVGEGSVFHFTIRVGTVDQPDEDPEISTPQPRRATDPAAILLVDDIDMNRVLARTMLENAGHQVTVAESGAEAIALLQERPFDLVLMDVMMPELDGIEATRRIRRLPGAVRNIPILALTANTVPEELGACEAAGMNGCVGKPIVWSELLALVDGLVAKGRTPPPVSGGLPTESAG